VRGAITFELCRRLVDATVRITEEGIASTLGRFVDEHHMLIDASAAVAVAGFYRHAARMRGKTVVIIICGANIALEVVTPILAAHVRAKREHTDRERHL
jgi:threonine dehydratase